MTEPIPYKLTRKAVVALAELIQDLAVQRMLADPDARLTLHETIVEILGDAGHADMARMWRETQ